MSSERRAGTASPHRPLSPLQLSHSEPDAPDREYPSGFQFAWIFLSLSLCVFLIGLDATIIATAIPRITDEFGSVDDIGWYDAAYRLASCMSQLSQGQLFANYPMKVVFLVNMVIFEAGVLICGLAPSSDVFILGRAVTGLGFSGVSQGCMVFIAMATPLPRRPTFIGLISASEFFAIAIAPLMGGAITSRLSWRWCFYINIPIAAAPAIVILFLLKTIPPDSTPKSHRERLAYIDFLGLVFFAPGIFCILLALQWGGTGYPWGNGRIVALLILGTVLFVVFGIIQWRKQDRAMLPPRLIQKSTILLGAAYAFSLASAMAITQFYMPNFFQAVAGATPLTSGIKLLPLVATLLAFSVGTGSAISLLGRYKTIQIVSALFVLAGAAVLSNLSLSPSIWASGLSLIGLGSGAGIACPFISVQAVLEDKDISAGMALLTFSQDLGESLMISGAQTIFLSKLRESLLRLGVSNPSYVIGLGATGFADHVGSGDVPLVKTSYGLAVRSVFYLASAIAAMLVISGALSKDRRLK